MNKSLFLLASTILFFPPVLLADTQMSWQTGKQIFQQNCATCHGRHGEKKAFGRSQIINTLDERHILQALRDRKSGRIQGGGNAVKARLTDTQLQDVAHFVPTLGK